LSIERFAINARANGALDVDVQLRNVSEAARLTMRVLDANLVEVGTPASADVAPGTTLTLTRSCPSGAAPESMECTAEGNVLTLYVLDAGQIFGTTFERR
jgi:hypothetical protein